jgi:hypothetical protein
MGAVYRDFSISAIPSTCPRRARQILRAHIPFRRRREISEPGSQLMQLAHRSDSVGADPRQLEVLLVGFVQLQGTVID